MENNLEIVEAWVNGNRSDVAAYLASAHPVITARLVPTWRAWVPNPWIEWDALVRLIIALLPDGEFVSVVSRD